MSFVSKVERIDSIKRKYVDFDASTLYYNEIPELFRDIKDEVNEITTIITWLDTHKNSDIEYRKALDSAARVKEMLQLAMDGMIDRKNRLYQIKERLEEEGETDEEYFYRNYCRPDIEDEEESDSDAD